MEPPPPAPAPAPAPHPAEQGMRSTLTGIGVNVFLAAGKGAAGVLGHSGALVADAVESAADVFSALVVWWGLKLSTRPADENHPHGHGKAEPLAALVVALALALAAVGIVRESVRQILVPHLTPAPWTLIVLVLVVVVKEGLFRWVFRVGEATDSGAVKGDAWHHRTDALTSAAAFIGISAALIGGRLTGDPRWASADDWAALLAAGVIGFNAVQIGKGSLYELTDAAPEDWVEEDIRRVALTIPGVHSLHRCLVRKSGFDYYVDLDVRVDRDMPVHEAHEIAHRVQDAVRAQVAAGRIARVLVHIEPTAKPN